MDPQEQPYIRYVPPDPDELDAHVEYDLEDDDSSWLAITRKTVPRELRPVLTEDLVERLIDRLEKELHSQAMQVRQLRVTSRPGAQGNSHERSCYCQDNCFPRAND